MTKKYYWAIAVAAAFVAGTMTTGGVVYASFDQCSNDPPQGISDGKPFLEIWAAICDLENKVNNIDTQDDLLGFYFTGDAVLATADDEVANIITVIATCDAGDIAVSAGSSQGSDQGSLNVLQRVKAGLTEAAVTWENVKEGYAYQTDVICADYAPAHIP
ncbi:MAG: hypothetical protein OEM89_06845 [Nitrosopumilus sp.]|nr:hypothetical protein [Nitrosopumilus sp.]